MEILNSDKITFDSIYIPYIFTVASIESGGFELAVFSTNKLSKQKIDSVGISKEIR